MIGAINLITLDMIFSGLPKLPDYGEEVSTETFRIALGGGPLASLVTAARLGSQTRLITSLGQDDLSRLVQSFLEKEPISLRSFTPEDAPGQINVSAVMTFPREDRCFASYFPGEDFYHTQIHEKAAYLDDCRYILACAPCDELLRVLAAGGKRILYDVGWREDLSLENYGDLLKHVYAFSPNEKEALKLTGCAGAEEALKVLSGYVTVPIVKLGSEGALYWDRDRGEQIHVPPFPVHAVDATGAGDAFLGGLAHGLDQGWDLHRCVLLANYCGGKATTAPGCLTARSTLEEFQSLLQEAGCL